MTSNRSTPTLDDVAKTAGVSTAMVSRCLNSPDRVVKSTREKVLKAVEILEYTPNFGARVMAAKRTFTIGAIIPTMENAILPVACSLFRKNYTNKATLFLCPAPPIAPTEKKNKFAH